MATKKIIFLLIVGIISIALSVGLFLLANQKEAKKASGEITVWINEGTTDDFQKIITGFNSANPKNKNIKINVEKKTTDPDQYRTLLLATIAEGGGPDIFMIPKGEDAILESKILSIPSEYIDVSDFENRFDEVFSSLITGSTKEKNQSILGVPLGYETLGVFYNRTLVRATSVPKTWTEVENIYSQFPAGKFPTNLGLSVNFVPNLADVLPIFFLANNIDSYAKMSNSYSPFLEYYSYADLSVATDTNTENLYAPASTLRSTESILKENKLTTFDDFIRGNIAMVFGFPSMVTELEKSYKRAGNNAIDPNLFLTEKIPQNNNNNQNIARYNYFAISKNSANTDASVQFLQYLASPEAEQIALETYPYLIPAQKDFYASSKNQEISSVFPRLRIDAFLPQAGTQLNIFDYGIKSKFLKIISENWNSFSSSSDLSTLGSTISQNIRCEINLYANWQTSSEC